MNEAGKQQRIRTMATKVVEIEEVVVEDNTAL